jgi:type VI protein secretion system component Hcp
VTKAVDVATPALARIAFVGTHVQQVTINISSGGSNNSPTQYTLDNVTVTNYQLSQSGAEGAGQLEQLTLSFDTITITVGTNTTCINTVTGATC